VAGERWREGVSRFDSLRAHSTCCLSRESVRGLGAKAFRSSLRSAEKLRHPNHVHSNPKAQYTKRTRIGRTDPNLGANGVEGLRVGSDPCARWPCGVWTGMHQKHKRSWLGRERARLVCGEEHVVQLFSKSEFQKIFRIFFHSFLWVFCVWFTLLVECMFSKHVTEKIKDENKLGYLAPKPCTSKYPNRAHGSKFRCKW
jgi:hypothetical protein